MADSNAQPASGLTPDDPKGGPMPKQPSEVIGQTQAEVLSRLLTMTQLLGELSHRADSVFDALKFRLSSSATHVVASTLGMLLIGASVLEVFINAFIPRVTFPVVVELATLIAGVVIFVMSCILDSITKNISINKASQEAADIARKAEFIREELNILRA
jgi:hypothetical protein